MIELTQKITDTSALDLKALATLSLTIDARIKSRQKATLDNGESAGLFLERGTLLRGGDVLSDGKGLYIMVKAANETVSTVKCSDALMLAKVAYHLGNRHVPLQIEAGFVRYQHDHVLDDMVRQLPNADQLVNLLVEQAPFEPEAGAYQQGGGHDHKHSPHHHSHDHSHSHSNEH